MHEGKKCCVACFSVGSGPRLSTLYAEETEKGESFFFLKNVSRLFSSLIPHSFSRGVEDCIPFPEGCERKEGKRYRRKNLPESMFGLVATTGNF